MHAVFTTLLMIKTVMLVALRWVYDWLLLSICEHVQCCRQRNGTWSMKHYILISHHVDLKSGQRACCLYMKIFLCKDIHCVQPHRFTQTNKWNQLRTHNPLWILTLCDILFIFITTDNALLLTKSSTSSSFSSSSSFSTSTNQVISSVEKLLLALPTITDPVGFGLHLSLRYLIAVNSKLKIMAMILILKCRL